MQKIIFRDSELLLLFQKFTARAQSSRGSRHFTHRRQVVLLVNSIEERRNSNLELLKMDPSIINEISSNRSFGGEQKIYRHMSYELGCAMQFAIYLPPQIENGKLPVIYWLSGLSCNETNFIQKAGAQKYASEHGFVVVCPDTSPRGCNIIGEDDSWDFGTGAGFYVDSTQDHWKKHYRMYSYIVEELPVIIAANFQVDSKKQSIMGHSMGGHGALICALKNPGKYVSVSAFAPICHPTQCPWGKKAFAGYLGSDEESLKEWENWDATHLVKKYDGPPLELFIDQGAADNFLKDGQLQPDKFVTACTDAKMPVILQMREGYDHSYFYIATFIEEHFNYHAKFFK